MGYRAHAMVIYGVEVEYQDFTVSVTKYDEDTGKPYSKSLPEKRLVLKSTGTEIDFGLLDKLAALFGPNAHDDYEHDTDDDGFGVFYSDHERDDNRVLGISVIADNYNNDVERVKIDHTAAKGALIDKLAALCIMETPALYSVLRHSY